MKRKSNHGKKVNSAGASSSQGLVCHRSPNGRRKISMAKLSRPRGGLLTNTNNTQKELEMARKVKRLVGLRISLLSLKEREVALNQRVRDTASPMRKREKKELLKTRIRRGMKHAQNAGSNTRSSFFQKTNAEDYFPLSTGTFGKAMIKRFLAWKAAPIKVKAYVYLRDKHNKPIQRYMPAEIWGNGSLMVKKSELGYKESLAPELVNSIYFNHEQQ